jgi:hypothetical protein
MPAKETTVKIIELRNREQTITVGNEHGGN